jgi:hypothetical protein
MRLRIAISLLLLITLQGCQNTNPANNNIASREVLQIIETSIKCQNQAFPGKNEPVYNKLIIYFNKRNCPSCLVEVKNYIDLMNRNYSVNAEFYSNEDNKDLNGIGQLIPSINLVKVDSLFADLEYPILFETNGIGSIVNCMPIHSSYLYLSLDYIKKYALAHPKQLKSKS